MIPGLVGSYCSYLLPKQDGGTSQIQVNPTQLRDHQNHPVARLIPIIATGNDISNPIFYLLVSIIIL